MNFHRLNTSNLTCCNFRLLLRLWSFAASLRAVAASTTTTTSLLFMEQYHFPVTSEACTNYSKSSMLSDDSSVFIERKLIYQAVKSVMGGSSGSNGNDDDTFQMNFTCSDSIDLSDTSLASSGVSGFFGSNVNFYLLSSDSYYFSSIPTIHFQDYYITRRSRFSPVSMSVFTFLNYLFYLSIFLTPIVSGVIVILLKDLKSFYDYQNAVYSLFRYLNRQGDQQMLIPLQKILAGTIAVFFFFHYAILLSEMTARRTYSLATVSRDAYRTIPNDRNVDDFSNKQYDYLYVDSLQYDFLRESYEINDELTDNTRNHYNLILNKSYFTPEQAKAIAIALINLQEKSELLHEFRVDPLFTNRNDDVFFNWLILLAAICTGISFSIAVVKFRWLNAKTEIKAFRSSCNIEVVKNCQSMLDSLVNDGLQAMLAKNSLESFKHVHVSSAQVFMGKQIFQVIQKKRKKVQKHKQKYRLPLALPTADSNLFKQQQANKFNLYGAIKAYIDVERKGHHHHHHHHHHNHNQNNNHLNKMHSIETGLQSHPLPIQNFQQSHYFASGFGGDLVASAAAAGGPGGSFAQHEGLASSVIGSAGIYQPRKSSSGNPDRLFHQNPKKVLNNLVRRISTRLEPVTEQVKLPDHEHAESLPNSQLLVAQQQQQQQLQSANYRRVGRNLNLNTVALQSLRQYDDNLNQRSKHGVSSSPMRKNRSIKDLMQQLNEPDDKSTASVDVDIDVDIDEGLIQEGGVVIPSIKETFRLGQQEPPQGLRQKGDMSDEDDGSQSFQRNHNAGLKVAFQIETASGLEESNSVPRAAPAVGEQNQDSSSGGGNGNGINQVKDVVSAQESDNQEQIFTASRQINSSQKGILDSVRNQTEIRQFVARDRIDLDDHELLSGVGSAVLMSVGETMREEHPKSILSQVMQQ